MSRLQIVLVSTALFVAAIGCQTSPDAEQTAPPSQGETPETAETAETQLGTVHLQPDCADEAQSDFQRGLAQLHHMWYSRARDSFQAAAEQDPECGMAHWGEAMTYYTPLWAPPTDDEFEAGADAAERASDIGGQTEREQAFIDAIQAFYEGERDERPLDERSAAFRDGWKAAHEQDPEDPEAASFYALGILATAPQKTDEYEPQKRAGAILEQVLEREPNHPGGHHYLLHAYDYPPLAERAVEVAKSYKDLAPSVPHALHMPSHIFTRLGQWDDVIDLNLRSAEAAKESPVNGAVSLHYYHAMDYVTFGALQTARDDDADQYRDETADESPPQEHLATAYASAAIPARLALERQDWEAAAEVEPTHPDALPWQRWPYVESITETTRAIGEIYTGEFDAAEERIDRIDQLREASADADSEYWRTKGEVDVRVARGLLQCARGDTETGIETLREASDLQNAVAKSPVTPGEVVVADEHLGDTLARDEQYADAIDAYQRALDRSARRYRSTYGVAQAARQAGDEQLARDYYRRLLDLTEGADSDRPELDEAREYLDKETGSEEARR